MQMMQFGGQKIPPLPYLLSNMVQFRTPRKYPEEERDIKRGRDLKKLAEEEQREEVSAAAQL